MKKIFIFLIFFAYFSNIFSATLSESSLLDKLNSGYKKSFIEPINTKKYSSILDIYSAVAWQSALDSILNLIVKDKIDTTRYYSNFLNYLKQITNQLTNLSQNKNLNFGEKKRELKNVQDHLQEQINNLVRLRNNLVTQIPAKSLASENQKKLIYSNLLLRAGLLLGNYSPKRELEGFTFENYPGGLIYFIDSALNLAQNLSNKTAEIKIETPIREKLKVVFTESNKNIV